MDETIVNINNEVTNKNKFITLFKIIFSVIIFFYLYTSVQFSDIFSTLRLADPILLLFPVIMVFPNIYFQFLKWAIICDITLKKHNKKEILLSLFYGFSGGIATPFRLGEYVGRSMAFDDKGLIEVSAATLIDKLFVMLAVSVFGVVSTIVFLQLYYGLKWILAAILYVSAIIFYIFLTYIVTKGEKFQERIKLKFKKKNALSEFINSLLAFRHLGLRNFINIFIVTVALCSVFILQFALLVAAYSNQYTIMKFVLAGTLVMFVKTIIPPITLGELGIREGASVFFLTLMGLNPAIALNASLTLFAFNILLPSLTGFILVLIKKNKIK